MSMQNIRYKTLKLRNRLLYYVLKRRTRTFQNNIAWAVNVSVATGFIFKYALISG